MKRIIKYMISCALPILFSGIAQAQMLTDTVCTGENICITTPSFRGNIQWQNSTDAITFTDIAGETNDTICTTITAAIYFRGVILENSCDSFYTDTFHFRVHNYERADTFNFTGSMQTFIVPADICDSIKIQCWGGEGASGAAGDGSSPGGTGGAGSYVIATFLATPGSTLNIFVGGAGSGPTGGFNGGGNGGNAVAGGGGGASDVRVSGFAESDRIITAGGGGGGGRGGCETGGVNGGNGGAGGNGVGGNNSPDGGGGFGGIGSIGGAQGIGCGGFVGAPGSNGSGGSGGVGGNGQACCCFSVPSVPGGGGGGGGDVGGGGGGGGSAGTTSCSGNNKGGGGGGAGGTSAAPTGSNVTITTGTWVGNGMIVISY
jgi:hypothetical protein